ncbi:MAG TPA: hypothetical protein ENJ80_10430 [Gammaproteobacteria bacterium]|nr:hypothetical protein [Gammaproteobacteria bacterium]
MGRIQQVLFVILLLPGYTAQLFADESAPWGRAGVMDIEYEPAKVLYDFASGDEDDLASVLDRAGYLYKLYGSDSLDSSVVVIVHGNAVPLFAIDRLDEHRDIMQRAQSLTVGTSIEFRMCRAAAKLLGYGPEDIHGFVRMVPMADAEIVRLQHEGYAYMR